MKQRDWLAYCACDEMPEMVANYEKFKEKYNIKREVRPSATRCHWDTLDPDNHKRRRPWHDRPSRFFDHVKLFQTHDGEYILVTQPYATVEMCVEMGFDEWCEARGLRYEIFDTFHNTTTIGIALRIDDIVKYRDYLNKHSEHVKPDYYYYVD